MDSGRASMALRARTGNSRRMRIGLIAFILSPLAVLTVLCVLIAQSMKHGQAMSATPVGAGAGHTGLSNEYMGIGKKSDSKPESGAAPAPKP